MIIAGIRIAVKLALQNQNGPGIYRTQPVQVMATSSKWSAL